MRYSRVIQRFYQKKKRLVQPIRYFGYWARRNSRNTIDLKKQYVYSYPQNQRIIYLARIAKIKLAGVSHWMVQET
jgi:hypothetical protein